MKINKRIDKNLFFLGTDFLEKTLKIIKELKNSVDFNKINFFVFVFKMNEKADYYDRKIELIIDKKNRGGV